MAWRALIVDDHELFRDGLKELIDSEADITVCGEAADSHEALEKFRELRPNLVTVDISLSKGDGLDLIARLKAIDPNVLILVVSMFEEAVYADRAIAAGATGYVCKQSANQKILDALRAVRRNTIYLSDTALNRHVQRSVGKQQAPVRPEEEQLSTRELQIFVLIGKAHTTQQIAQLLNLSPSTVETYRERIKGKLNLANGTELTHRAITWTLHNS